MPKLISGQLRMCLHADKHRMAPSASGKCLHVLVAGSSAFRRWPPDARFHVTKSVFVCELKRSALRLLSRIDSPADYFVIGRF